MTGSLMQPYIIMGHPLLCLHGFYRTAAPLVGVSQTQAHSHE